MAARAAEDKIHHVSTIAGEIVRKQSIRIAMAVSICLLGSGNAQAVNCKGSLKRPEFDFQAEKIELDKKVQAINLWWSHWRANPGLITFEEALARRQSQIDAIYSGIREKRRKVYTEAACTVTSDKKCSSNAGEKRLCPMQKKALADTRFDMRTLKLIGDDFEIKPHLNGASVEYTVKKTGRGSNTAGFSADVVFLDEVVEQFVAEDLAQVQQYISPLLNQCFN